ncbi:hypothetical protein K440DRAFT_23150 [Wilcoxina mikolae CBS 423.85]|nr:hypothetical protein K440DRAFT_23150 [Wilcoxina mikolae CBS 423.85]
MNDNTIEGNSKRQNPSPSTSNGLIKLAAEATQFGVVTTCSSVLSPQYATFPLAHRPSIHPFIHTYGPGSSAGVETQHIFFSLRRLSTGDYQMPSQTYRMVSCFEQLVNISLCNDITFGCHGTILWNIGCIRYGRQQIQGNPLWPAILLWGFPRTTDYHTLFDVNGISLRYLT